MTIRFDSYENADEHLVRVLEVRNPLCSLSRTPVESDRQADEGRLTSDAWSILELALEIR